MTFPSRYHSYSTLLAIVLLVVLFSVCLRVPLSHTDLWGHLAYGRHYAEAGRLPPAEPFLKLSHSEPFVTTSWLTQWFGFQIYRTAGPFGLQLSYAVLSTALFALIYWLTVRRTNQPWIGIISMLLFGALEYQQLIIIRPQLAGIVCYCLLLNLLFGWGRDKTSSPASEFRQKWKMPLLIALLMLVWTNLHGSFVFGPVMIAMVGAGELLDHLRKVDVEKKPSTLTSIRETTVLISIALIAGLFNPYGLSLYREVMTFSFSPNLYQLIEWKPLSSTPKQGTVFAVATALGFLVVVYSNHRFYWRDWLPVLVLAVMTIKTSRYIVWFAPMYVAALVPHLNDLLTRSQSRSGRLRKLIEFSQRKTSSGRALTLLMIALAVFTDSFLRSSPYDSQTPIDATEQLLRAPQQSLILNTMEWGDWMIWRSRASLPVMVNSHVTLIPPEIWQDYITLIKLKSGWREVLAKYPFSAAILQRGRQRRLIRTFEQNPTWKEIYRDEIAVIFLLIEEA